MLQKRFSRLLALLLSALVFSSSVAAVDPAPVTVEELVSELIIISTLLNKAQTEYQAGWEKFEKVSTELDKVSTKVVQISDEEIPTLKQQIADSKDSFSDYKAEVLVKIRRLKTVLWVLGGTLATILGIDIAKTVAARL